MTIFDTMKANDQDFGNTWITELIFANGSKDIRTGERPIQYSGVHGLVHLYKDEYHILNEDDGHFYTKVIVSKDEVTKIHKYLSEFITNFSFKGHYVVNFDDNIELNRVVTKDTTLTIVPRGITAPLINISIKEIDIIFDVNWLINFITVLDINKPIKA